MNVNDAIKKMLADPEFLERAAKSYEEKLEQEKRMREEFIQSEVFSRMLATLRDNPAPRSVDSEEVAYFADKVKRDIGWEFASQQDLDMFVSVLGRSSADTVEPGSHEEDDDCSFDNVSFRHYGLHVSVMHGQGSFVRISNNAAAMPAA